MSREKQISWKRTQVRLPQELYDLVDQYAKNKKLSLNSAFMELMQKGLAVHDVGGMPQNIKIIKLENGKKRYVFGKLVPLFDVDYTNPKLYELRDDIESCLKILSESISFKDRLRFFNKNVIATMGSNHIDVVDDGVGSLNWVVVEDHLTDEYMKLKHDDIE